jgi:hypothetical protein
MFSFTEMLTQCLQIICKGDFGLLYFQFAFWFDNWYEIIFFRNLKNKKWPRPKVCHPISIVISRDIQCVDQDAFIL